MTGLPTLRTSERSAFRRCPQKWWWEYRDGLVPKGEVPDARWFGIGIHLALAEWYGKGKRRGRHPAKVFAEWCGDKIREIRAAMSERDSDWYDEPKYEDAYELGVAMLNHYVETYGKDPEWHVIATEQSFQVKVQRAGKPIAIFASTFDGVIRDESDGEIYLMEHKTASQIQLPYLELDDQAGVYWAVAQAVLRAKGVLKADESIAGIVYNFLRKSKPDPRPRNATGAYLNMDGSVSKKQPADPFVRHIVERQPQEQKSQMERLSDEVAWMNAVRSGTLPVIKNTTKDCTFCDFFDMCKLHERGGDAWKELKRSLYTQKDPYADRYAKSASTGG